MTTSTVYCITLAAMLDAQKQLQS